MKNKIKNILFVLLFLNPNVFAQETKLDTLKRFQGHWIFKMAMNSDYTPKELEKTYLKQVRRNKIHVQGTRVYGNFFDGEYESQNLNLNEMPTNGGIKFLDNEFEETELIELKKLGIVQQTWMGIYQTPYKPFVLPYFSLQLLTKQELLVVGMDQTMFFLEKDKSKYMFAKNDTVIIFNSKLNPTYNKLLKNEEVEILEIKDNWAKIRYWGKVLLKGWVKTNELKVQPQNKDFWEIYKNNIIKLKIKNTQAIIYDANYQSTKMYLIKGDIVEIIKESGSWLNIKYYGKKTIEGWIKKSDVE